MSLYLPVSFLKESKHPQNESGLHERQNTVTAQNAFYELVVTVWISVTCLAALSGISVEGHQGLLPLLKPPW